MSGRPDMPQGRTAHATSIAFPRPPNGPLLINAAGVIPAFGHNLRWQSVEVGLHVSVISSVQCAPERSGSHHLESQDQRGFDPEPNCRSARWTGRSRRALRASHGAGLESLLDGCIPCHRGVWRGVLGALARGHLHEEARGSWVVDCRPHVMPAGRVTRLWMGSRRSGAG